MTREALAEVVAESDARTMRQFILTTFDGLGPDASRGDTPAIEAVQKEDVLRVARRVIDLEHYTEALVG